jgi:8-oxo-dGTP diphosphatase
MNLIRKHHYTSLAQGPRFVNHSVDKKPVACYHGWSDRLGSKEMKREYPVAPVVAVGVIIQDGGRIVLVRRDKEPSKGLWTFPGGAVELGESLRDAAMREAREETGLRVEIGEPATVIDHLVDDGSGRIRYHYVIIDYLARPVGGTLRPGTDASEARWVSLTDLDGLDMTEKAGELARALLGDVSQDG